MITIKLATALLPALSTAGAGVFAAALWVYLKNRQKAGMLMAAAFVLFAAAFVSLMMSLGNPGRIFNILSNPSAAFSRAAMGVVLLTVWSAAMVVLWRKNNSVAYLGFGLVGLLIIVYMYWGLIGMNIKPSRPALNSWHVPLFLAAGACALGGYAAGSRFLRVGGLLLKAAAVSFFMYHLAELAVPDRYLSLELLNRSVPGLLYGGIIALGIVLPLLAEPFIKPDRRSWLPCATATAVFIGNVAFFILVAITVSKSGNMI